MENWMIYPINGLVLLGKTRNHVFSHEIWGFPVTFPLNQSVEYSLIYGDQGSWRQAPLRDGGMQKVGHANQILWQSERGLPNSLLVLDELLKTIKPPGEPEPIPSRLWGQIPCRHGKGHLHFFIPGGVVIPGSDREHPRGNSWRVQLPMSLSDTQGPCRRNLRSHKFLKASNL